MFLMMLAQHISAGARFTETFGNHKLCDFHTEWNIQNQDHQSMKRKYVSTLFPKTDPDIFGIFLNVAISTKISIKLCEFE